MAKGVKPTFSSRIRSVVIRKYYSLLLYGCRGSNGDSRLNFVLRADSSKKILVGELASQFLLQRLRLVYATMVEACQIF